MATALKEYLDKVAPKPGKTTDETEDFSQIELTAEEEKAAVEAAIRKAKEEKFYAIRKAEYWNQVNATPEVKRYTTNQLKSYLRASKTPSGKQFVVDEQNRRVASLICQYFACDPEFEKEKDITGNPYSLTKGLCLMGNVGLGKTYMMGFFHFNQNASYVMANCRRIEGKWVDQMSNKDKPAKNVIDHYSGEIDATDNPFGHPVMGVCFDDLGTETVPSKAYGEEKHVLAEILMNRYEARLPYNFTHITTNLSAHDIGIKYGTRVKDRFREMFNLIQFDNEAKSRR